MIDLNPTYLETIKGILARHVPECEVRAFGSRVTWTAKDYSDLDLAVVGAHALNSDTLRGLRDAFEESDLPFRVDVVDWHAIGPAFRKVIEKQYEVVQNARRKSPGMAGEWAPIRLGDVCTKIGSGATPRGGSDVYLEDGPYALIRSQNVYNDGFHHDGLALIDENHAAELENVEVLEGDVLLNITGDSVARSCQVDPGVLPARVNQHVAIIRPDPSRLAPRFLRYVLVSPEMQAKLLSWAGSGGTRNALTKGMIESLEVLAPADVAEQRAIAHILGTLDDKIELNRRMSQTLEQMARALFKSWFVDFDPVRAKMEGRDPGLPKHIVDLFPDRLVDSELGEIPEGWEVKRLSDLCATQYGYTASAVDMPVGPKFLRVTDINKRNWIEWGDVPHCEIDSDAKQAYALKIGDLIVARMADPGKSAIIEEEIDAVFASYLVRLKTRSLAHSYYVYGFLKSDLYAEYAEGARSGSVQANMNAKVIVGATLVVPPRKVMEEFLGLVLPLRQRLVSNTRESRTLAALRDALLPKLISGELRVKERGL
jgi:type I restriction enzyme S subunit